MVKCQEWIDKEQINLNCPRGYYQDTSANSQLLTRQECQPCPRGTYAPTSGSVNQCPYVCPSGRYNDKFAAVTIDDCRLCPPGTYGETTGLTSARCSGQCPPGKYGRTFGESKDSHCIDCPPGYFGNQCNLSKRGTADEPNTGSVIAGGTFGQFDP